MKKSVAIFIEHILESIAWIERYMQGVTKSEFIKSLEKQDAVVRRLEIVGEAAKQIPEDFRRKHADIPWRDITGMRDNLIHEYFNVDEEEVWKTITVDVPELKEKLLEIQDSE